jgi:hypothetical protein
VNDLIAQAGYSSHYYESFLQAMKRGRTIAMSDVDVNTKDSTHWWTLYYENQRPTSTGGVTTPGHIIAYSPFSFDDRSSTVLLGAIVTEETLFDLPGPIITHTVGPFAALRTPVTLDDIPAAFKGRTFYNRHVPAIAYFFTKTDDLNNAGAILYGHMQNDQTITDLTQLFYEYDSDESTPPPARTTSKSRTAKKSSKKDKSFNKDSTADALNPVGPATSGLFVCTIMYFDHVIANSVPHIRRANVVTSANALD